MGVFRTLALGFMKCENHQEIRADVAQPVEQRFRKPPVGSSSLPVGSGNRGLPRIRSPSDLSFSATRPENCVTWMCLLNAISSLGVRVG